MAVPAPEPPVAFLVLMVGVLAIALISAVCAFRRPRWEQFDPMAEEMARHLLLEMLSEEERRQVDELGYLQVQSPSRPTRVYRIPALTEGMVAIHESGRLIEKLCLGPAEGPLPPSDLVLMHKLMIEGNEEKYLSEAHLFPEYPGAASLLGGSNPTPGRAAWRRLRSLVESGFGDGYDSQV